MNLPAPALAVAGADAAQMNDFGDVNALCNTSRTPELLQLEQRAMKCDTPSQPPSLEQTPPTRLKCPQSPT